MGSNKMFLYLAIAFSAPALSLSCSEKQLDAAQMGFRWWQISSASCNSKLLLSYLHILIRHFHLARVLWQITWFNHNMLFREFLTTLILSFPYPISILSSITWCCRSGTAWRRRRGGCWTWTPRRSATSRQRSAMGSRLVIMTVKLKIDMMNDGDDDND